MGYQVTALASLTSDIYHETFMVYVPTSRLQYEWINDWVYEHFSLLSKQLGPKAVLVTPPRGSQYEDLEQWRGQPDPFTFAGDQPTDFLHSHFPFLAIGSSASAGGEKRAVVTNLAAFPSPEALGAFWDRVVASGRSGDDLRKLGNLVPPTELQGEYDSDLGGWNFAFENALELKPNFFGIGLNLNALATWWRQRREGREHRRTN